LPSGLVIVNLALPPSVPFGLASMQSTSVPILAPFPSCCFDVIQNMVSAPSVSTDQLNVVVPSFCPEIQEEAGKLVGNPDQQVKGLQNQVEGKTHEKIGDLKEAVKDAIN
jgi:uncharacterized protein YjbJ (UPF0337 family)